MKNLADKYRINRKGLETVIEELKQWLLAKAAKIKRYNERIIQYRQNRMFAVDRKKVLNELNGEARGQNVFPSAEESRKFWSEIWGIRKEHNRQAEWLNELKRRQNNVRMEEAEITTETVKSQSRKILNWKTPGRDGVQGYWIKNLTSMHERIAIQLNEIVCGVSRLPEWMTYGRTVFCQKDSTKGWFTHATFHVRLHAAYHINQTISSSCICKCVCDLLQLSYCNLLRLGATYNLFRIEILFCNQVAVGLAVLANESPAKDHVTFTPCALVATSKNWAYSKWVQKTFN